MAGPETSSTQVDDLWDKYRGEIIIHYIELKKSLPEVRATLNAQSNGLFNPPERAYKTKLHLWGIYKNLPACMVEYIFRLAEENRQSGLGTNFYWNNSRVSVSKIKRTQRRLGSRPNRRKRNDPPLSQLLHFLRVDTFPLENVGGNQDEFSNQNSTTNGNGQIPAIHDQPRLPTTPISEVPDQLERPLMLRDYASYAMLRPVMPEAIKKKLAVLPSADLWNELDALLNDHDNLGQMSTWWRQTTGHQKCAELFSKMSEKFDSAAILHVLLYNLKMPHERPFETNARVLDAYHFLFGVDMLYCSEALDLCERTCQKSSWRDALSYFFRSVDYLSGVAANLSDQVDVNRDFLMGLCADRICFPAISYACNGVLDLHELKNILETSSRLRGSNYYDGPSMLPALRMACKFNLKTSKDWEKVWTLLEKCMECPGANLSTRRKYFEGEFDGDFDKILPFFTNLPKHVLLPSNYSQRIPYFLKYNVGDFDERCCDWDDDSPVDTLKSFLRLLDAVRVCENESLILERIGFLFSTTKLKSCKPAVDSLLRFLYRVMKTSSIQANKIEARHVAVDILKSGKATCSSLEEMFDDKCLPESLQLTHRPPSTSIHNQDRQNCLAASSASQENHPVPNTLSTAPRGPMRTVPNPAASSVGWRGTHGEQPSTSQHQSLLPQAPSLFSFPSLDEFVVQHKMH